MGKDIDFRVKHILEKYKDTEVKKLDEITLLMIYMVEKNNLSDEQININELVKLFENYDKQINYGEIHGKQ